MKMSLELIRKKYNMKKPYQRTKTTKTFGI